MGRENSNDSNVSNATPAPAPAPAAQGPAQGYGPNGGMPAPKDHRSTFQKWMDGIGTACKMACQLAIPALLGFLIFGPIGLAVGLCLGGGMAAKTAMKCYERFHPEKATKLDEDGNLVFANTFGNANAANNQMQSQVNSLSQAITNMNNLANEMMNQMERMNNQIHELQQRNGNNNQNDNQNQNLDNSLITSSNVMTPLGNNNQSNRFGNLRESMNLNEMSNARTSRFVTPLNRARSSRQFDGNLSKSQNNLSNSQNNNLSNSQIIRSSRPKF